MSVVRGMIFSASKKFIPAEMYFEDGVIEDIRALSDGELSSEEKESYIIPGLIDMHMHGACGIEVCDTDEEGLLKIAEFEQKCGVTSFCPTTMTLPKECLTKIVKTIKSAADKEKAIKGIYLEGPFLSKEKCGAQKKEYLLNPDIDLLESLNNLAEGLIKKVAIAPETEGAVDFIEKYSDRFSFSMAHTVAGYDLAVKAIKAGVKGVTHLYNGMSPYNHRDPGVVGAVFDSEEVRAELIADGIHLHPAVVRNAFRVLGPGRIALISDSCPAAGYDLSECFLGGQKVYIKGRRAELADGTLAGSASTLFDCFNMALLMGIPLEQVIISSTETPAKMLGIFDTVGSLEPGKQADFIVLNKAAEVEIGQQSYLQSSDQPIKQPYIIKYVNTKLRTNS